MTNKKLFLNKINLLFKRIYIKIHLAPVLVHKITKLMLITHHNNNYKIPHKVLIPIKINLNHPKR